ncbi:VTT domain-containing protein [Ahniella affigens]|nr:VTT domain-containing protein [Ahniella affigens]
MNRATFESVPEPSPVSTWWRAMLLSVTLLGAVLVPFALWGDALEHAAPMWLANHQGPLWLAALGILLLIADVLLPIPSSVVAMALCWSLGPWLGGCCVAVGSFLSFATGYGLGRIVPEPRLRRFIGARAWDRLRDRAGRSELWWIVLSRPLPVFAELSALLAGVWRLPLISSLGAAAAASLGLGVLYGGSAWLGARSPSTLLSLLLLSCLPTAFWLLHRWWLWRVAAGAHSTEVHTERLS